jgi:alkaline phosphatase
MQHYPFSRKPVYGFVIAALCGLACNAFAAPAISRLTPPSELFASGNAAPVIARFLPGQKFDLQATVRPDNGQAITSVTFKVDGVPVASASPGFSGRTSITPATAITGSVPNAVAASARGFSKQSAGIHTLTAIATQSDGQTVTATGNFEIVGIKPGLGRVKNIIIMLGDGMGAAHRTAARIMAKGYAQGKARDTLAMDTFPVTGMVMTASLNSIVTDSAPGMSNYVTGNKANNNQEGVFPDDTTDPFDNPRVEYLSEYLHRTRGTALGIVTTADVFDATPAANAVHTADRGKGTGITDQFLDDRSLTGLSVLMGGGRKWFIPKNAGQSAGTDSVTHTFNEIPGGLSSTANGSARSSSAGADYVLPADLQVGWSAAAGAIDPNRDLIADFQNAGFAYAPDKIGLDAAMAGNPNKLLGLFSLSNMNVAMDKINGRRGTSRNVDDYGFPNQPMLDEMTAAALKVLSRSQNGFVAMIEGASIDKQAHLMDSDRWIEETIEFDRAVQVAKDFADKHPGTLVIVTADHECSGAAIIGASTISNSELVQRQGTGVGADANGNGVVDGGDTVGLRLGTVGTYDAAKFPRYTIEADGYPQTTDVDFKMLIGYGANADRYESWLANPEPTQDSQQPFVGATPLNAYPANPNVRNARNGFLVTGQVPGEQAVHTATDIPLSAYGRGAYMFTGVMDNTDVFFKLGQAVLGGVLSFSNDDHDRF